MDCNKVGGLAIKANTA